MDTPRDITFSEQDLRAEIEELRIDLLHMLLVAVPCLGLIWLFYAVWRNWHLNMPLIASTSLLLGSFFSASMKGQRYRIASCFMLLSLIIAINTMVTSPSNSAASLLGVLVVVLAHSLLGLLGGLVGAAAMWGSITVANQIMYTAQEMSPVGYETLVVYLLVLGTVWLAAQPLSRSIALALAGWSHAHDALGEVRQRRQELYRAIRALEEATYRIERMNNELLLARQEAEEARALKSRFVTAVSHELRSPLNLVLGFTRLMVLSPESYGEPLPQSYRRDIHTIYQNCQHLLALVNDILDLAQIEARRFPLVKDRVNLAEDIIDKVVRSVQPLADRKHLWLRTEVPETLPWVLADPVRLRQALLNLLSNGLRVTEKGGITIRASLEDEHAILSVEDTGPGISSGDMPTLFREFSELTQTADEKSSGLGLAITKHLIELHGGQIWVESEVGKGTVFSFSVPLPGTQQQTGSLLRSSDVAFRTTTEQSCLIVHEEMDVVNLVARHLVGYHVVGVTARENLLAFVDELHPKAIVTAPQIAEGIVDQLSSVPIDVPIITCDIPSVGDQSAFSHVIGYLIKPIAPESLAAVMNRVLKDEEMTVLLVDDEPDAVRLLERMLTTLPHPYNIIKAYDGAQALSMMREIVPDVLFLDMVMPGMDGLQVLEAMRAEERLAHVPTFIISGKDWIDENTTLGQSIHVKCGSPLSIDQGVACIQAIMDALSPKYLNTLAASQQSAVAPRPE